MITRVALALLLSLFYSLHGAYAASQDKPTLIILNWSDYLDPALVSEFESRYDVQVKEVYYETDDERTQMLLDNNAAGYDLILSSGVDLEAYIKLGWIAPMRPELIPNLKHIDPKWRQAFAGASDHAVPYFWGTVGIIYRSDRLKKPITSWLQLYRPDPELQGYVGMIDSGRDLLSMALKALGHPLNSTDPAHLAAAKTLLQQLQPHVRSYKYLLLDENSEMLSGDILASMIYSGDALMLQEHSDDLTYVTPTEGTNLWVDYFTLGAKGSQPELAHQFLNFINEPENAAQQSEFVYYATPNLAAEALLPQSIRDNPVIYPDDATLSRSEFYRQFDIQGIQRRNAILLQLGL